MAYSDKEVVRDYKQYVPIENLVTAQIDRIVKYRNEGKLREYEVAIETLIDLLHPDAERLVMKYKHDNSITIDITSKDALDKYRSLFNFIKSILSEDNIIWKRSRGYEKGHD